MAAKAKVLITDYVWESTDVEKKILEGLGWEKDVRKRTPNEKR